MREKNFGARLYSMFMGSMLIPVLVAMLCFLSYSNYTIMDKGKKNGLNMLNSVSQNIELQFSDILNIKDSFYIHKGVFQEAEALNNPNLYQYYDELTKIGIEDTYTITLTKMIHTLAPEVRAIVFFPVSGESTVYYLGKDSGDLKKIDYSNYQEEIWYEEAVEHPEEVAYYEPHLPEYIPNKRLGKVYSCVSAVRNLDTRKVIGVVKIDIDVQMLQNTLDMLDKSEDGGFLIFREDQIFARSKILEGDIEQIREDTARIGKKTYYLQRQKIPNSNLELVYLDSNAALYRGYFYVVLFAVLIVAIGVGLAFINYRRQAKKMVDDVGVITDAIQHVERGELDAYIEIREDSEFYRIAEVINHMMEQLKEYIEKEYVLVIQQQKAEYRALQSQVNPHFLYNTLNGFIALNRMGEKKALERSIVGLSKLFRYVCSQQEEAALEDEFTFLEEYLKLEKLKYDERLGYSIWIDDQCRKKRIPKLLLQPIVENSLKHGMGNTDRSITIWISANQMEVTGIGRLLILMVQDNGIGFDSRKMIDQEMHVGIENVRIRAELYCKNAIYQCVSTPDKGTKTVFVFPEEQ